MRQPNCGCGHDDKDDDGGDDDGGGDDDDYGGKSDDMVVNFVLEDVKMHATLGHFLIKSTLLIRVRLRGRQGARQSGSFPDQVISFD